MTQFSSNKQTTFFHLLCILLLNSCLILELKSQASLTDTLYETTNSITWLSASNDHFGWYESSSTDKRLYRGFENTIESQILDNSYFHCNTFEGLYIYNDFIHMGIGDDTDPYCREEFIWDGPNNLIIDPLNIGEVYEQHNHLLFNSRDTLTNLDTRTKERLFFETTNHTYRPSNIITINDTYLHAKAFKYDKVTNGYLGDAIIKYNLQSEQTEELFFSTNFLYFGSSDNGDKIAFIEDQPYPTLEKLYYYDGSQVVFVAQRDVTNSAASAYLDGVVYVSDDSLFYWEDGSTYILGEDAFRFVIEGCKLAWFSGFGNDAQVNLYDGSKYVNIPFVGYQEHYSLSFLSESSVIFTFKEMSSNTRYIVKGEHLLNNPSNCNFPDSDVFDDLSYFKTLNLTADVDLNKPNTIYRATESIQLLPGFHAKANAIFHAEIVTCTPQSPLMIASPRNKEEAEKGPHISLPRVASLAQNTPNPFSYRPTKIEYFIPTNSQQANLKIFNSWGQIIKQLPIKNRGVGVVEIPSVDFEGGIYHYTLEVDGKVVDSKKMIVIK